jgi:hypothetical protein
MPVFHNNCFSAASPFFIPPFRNLRKPASNNEATSHGSGDEGPGEQEARERLRARKDQLWKAADNDDVIKYDKLHAANLLSRPSPTLLVECDSTITAAAHAQPPPSLSINPHQTPPSEPAKHNQDNGREQREGAGAEDNKTGKNERGKRERVAGEVEEAAGEHPPHIETPTECHDEHENEVGTHKLVHAAALAIEPPQYDRVPGACNPPPPPPDPPPPFPPPHPP